jgi:type IV pilus assembly protein PilW
MTLVELLVALVIGVVLIFGATQVYVDSRKTYAVNETVARLQETARYAISVIEPDVRMSNYWGLIKGAESITGSVRQTAGQTGLGGAAAVTCGNNYAQDLGTNIEGTNDGYTAACAPRTASGPSPAMPFADTLTIRRAASVADVPPVANGPLRVCTTRTAGTLVTDTTTGVCPGAAAVPATAQINDLIVSLYYVDQNSDQQAGLPSLRRYFLTATPDFTDQEITPGVEDMQIQYGVDRTGGVGATGGAATEYLDAGAALTALLTDPNNPSQIVSVRIWLLVRGDTPEVGFTDNRVYEYGDRLQANGTTGDLTAAADSTKAYQPSLNANNSATSVKRYRRLLVSRTIQLRNALGT